MTSSFLLIQSAKIFLAVCHKQSFSAAAKELGLTQPAVSAAVSRLEEHLGVDLVHRTRPLEITPEGATLEKLLLAVADKMDSVITDIQRRQNLLPVIRIGLIDSLYDLIGMDLIVRFRSIASRISLIGGTSDQLLDALKLGKLDIVVAGESFEDKIQTLHKQFILQEETVVVFPKAIAQTRSTWSWENIRYSGLPLIRYAHSSSNERLLEELKATHKLEFQTAVDVDSNRLMLSLVSRGDGWAITHPACLMHSDLMGALQILSPKPALGKRTLYVFYPRTGLSEYVGIVTNLVRESFPSAVPLQSRQEE